MDYGLLDDLFAPQVNFALGGRTFPEYDCYGLVIEVCKRLGIIIPAFVSPPEEEDFHKTVLAKEDLFTKLDAPEDHCIVLLNTVHRIPTHVGVVLEYPRFIHIMKGRRVAIERLTSIFWSTRVKGFYR